MLGKRPRSKKRSAPPVTNRRVVQLAGQTKPLRKLDMALIEENEQLAAQQERYHW